MFSQDQYQRKYQCLFILSPKSAFKATIIHEIFEKSSSFHVKYLITEKIHFLFFMRFLLVLIFPNFLSLRLFGNS